MARKLLAPDGAVKQTEVQDPNGVTRRYDSSTGYVTVSDSDARALAREGFTPASLSGTTGRGVGRRCRDCGFGSFFTTCSRCGGTCDKEN